ncbi:MAG: SDR family oxidoreductase [Anaerolineae bacterium]|nr:SDR family oxidoreductase [Anaerolineae bacterium]
MQLSGQVAFITGAGRGIGEATALTFAREGADIVLAARTDSELQRVAARVRELGRRALPCVMNLADEQSIAHAVELAVAEFGHIDSLVNNAGVIDFSPISSAPIEMWDRIMNVNLRGVMILTNAVLSTMRRQAKGTIIMVSAIGAFGGGGIAPIYRASKAALNNVAEAYAQETLGGGIRVNTICIAETDTQLCRSSYPSSTDTTKWMKPEDVADVILFLASDQSRTMTGATLIACGTTKLSRWG